VVKLAGGLGDALFDGKPAFSITNSINFDVPGGTLARADFRVLSHEPLLDTGWKYNDDRGLVDSTGKVYDGDEPYIVISLDGKKRDNLKDFAPTVASAAILQKFFNMRDRAAASIDTLVDGIKLASDMKYRDQAVALKSRIDALPAGDEKARLQAQYDALLENIGNPVLKPGG
jgi:hypothetical protein